MALVPLIGSYSAASLASAADVPIDFPMIDGTLERIDIYLKEVMDGGDATFNFGLNGVDLYSGGDRWIIEDGERHFSKTGIGQAVVIGDYVNSVLEEISGGTVVEPILILMWVEDGNSVVADEVHAATAKSTPVDADELATIDSADSWALKRTTYLESWTNYFKAKADALYVALTGNQTVAGVKTFSSSPVVPTPSGATDAVNKQYVDNISAGIKWKNSVRAATTANGTLASDFENGDTIDGVVLATGDRILLKNQSTATENGIYTVNASGAPTRATDADTGSELVSATVPVDEGTANADTNWRCTNNSPITLGSTNLVFASFSVGGLSDGDYGDVTVSGGGSAIAIDNDVVTYAKMQDVSATARLLGRKTAGSGDPEEVTIAEALNFIASLAQGDILYHNGTSFVRLAAGTNGHYLQTQGAGANPQWAAAAGGSSVSGGSFDIDCGDAASAGDFVINCGDAT